MNRLEVRLELPAKAAETCRRSIEIEAGNASIERSTVEITSDGGVLRLIIKAHDLVALRAAMNTYLRWVGMCSDLVLKNKK